MASSPMRFSPLAVLLVLMEATGESGPDELETYADAFAERSHVYQNVHNLAVAVRRGKWKLIWPIQPEYRWVAEQPVLFDLDADPGELADRAAEHPDLVDELRGLLEPWIALGKRPVAADVDEDTLEQLRALGYLGD